MTESNINRIAEKVKKLLAMSDEDSGASDAERAMAIRQATSLMDKYALDIDTVKADTSDTRGESSLNTGTPKWKPLVFSALGKLYGAVVYMQGKGRERDITVIGRESARVTILSMGAWLISNIERECKERGYKRTGGEADSFKKGAAFGIHYKVDEILAERARGETVGSSSKALAVVDAYIAEEKANKQYLDDKGRELKTGRSLRVSNNGAYRSGKQYGSNVNLNGQLNRANQRRLSS